MFSVKSSQSPLDGVWDPYHGSQQPVSKFKFLALCTAIAHSDRQLALGNGCWQGG